MAESNNVNIKETIIAPKGIRFVKSDKSTSYYASSIEMRVSLFDFQLKCGESTSLQGDTVIFEEQVTIILSPQHAKIFAAALSQNISKYEETFGPIPGPPEKERVKN